MNFIITHLLASGLLAVTFMIAYSTLGTAMLAQRRRSAIWLLYLFSSAALALIITSLPSPSGCGSGIDCSQVILDNVSIRGNLIGVMLPAVVLLLMTVSLIFLNRPKISQRWQIVCASMLGVLILALSPLAVFFALCAIWGSCH